LALAAKFVATGAPDAVIDTVSQCL